MTRPRDYHALGLPPDAAPGDVRETYRELVRIWDPARFAHEGELRPMAERRLHEIRTAYRELADAGRAADGSGYRPSARARVPRGVVRAAVWWATLLLAIYLVA